MRNQILGLIDINRIKSFSTRFILASFAIFTTIVMVLGIHFFTANCFPVVTKMNWLTSFIEISPIILGSIVLFVVRDDSKWVKWAVILVMLVLFTAVATVWIKSVPSTQVSDFGIFWNKANIVSEGGHLYDSENDYFATNAYQTGFVLYLLLLIKMFAANTFAMQFTNVLIQVAILLLTYVISLKIFKKVKIARLAMFLLMADLDWFALNSQADNQYLGSLLYLITFYLILQGRTWMTIASGFTLAMGWLIRPIGPAVFFGIIIYLVIFEINHSQKNFFPELLLKVVVPAGLCLLTLFGTGVMIQNSGLNPHGLRSENTEWKFVVGLNYKTLGTYSTELNDRFKFASTQPDIKHEERRELQQEISYLSQNNNWLKLFLSKFSLLWSGSTNASDLVGFDKTHSPDSNQVVEVVGYLGSMSLIVFSWFGALQLFRREYNGKILLLLLPLLIFAAIELIIEVQGRYRIELLPVISVVSGLGLFSVYSFMENMNRVKFSNYLAKMDFLQRIPLIRSIRK